MLEQYPNGPELNTQAGLALYTEGRYPDALHYFELGAGGDLYAQGGAGRHAECLRETGQPQAAQALHLERLWETTSTDEAFAIWLQLLQDRRNAGDLNGAWDALYTAEGIHPESPVVAAWAAELEMDEGQLEAAEVRLNASEHLSATPPRRWVLARARLYLLQGTPELALELLSEQRQGRRRFPLMAAMQAHAMIATGDVEGARDLVNTPLFAYRLEPELIALRAQLQE